MRLVCLQKGPPAGSGLNTAETSNFTTTFNPPFRVAKSSEVALQSLTLKLTPGLIPITPATASIGFSLVPPTDPNYSVYVAEHTATIQTSQGYSVPDLELALNTALNSQLYFTGAGDYAREQGAEIYADINTTTLVPAFSYAARIQNEWCAPPTVDVDFVGATYDYAVLAGPPSLGTLTRTAATVNTPDTYLTTKDVFSRGSGCLQFKDESSYILAGAWTGNGTGTSTFTSTADFLVAGLGFPALAPFMTLRDHATDEYTAATVAQGGGGGNKAVVTVAGGAVTDGADSIILQAGVGWVAGFIETRYLSDPASILDNLRYGVACPNYAMVNEPGSPFEFGAGASVYWYKPDDAWFYDLPNPKVPDTDDPQIRMTLGRQTAAAGVETDYKMHLEQWNTAGDTFVQSIYSLDTSYGNYAMVLGICGQAGVLSGIRWTASKINNTPSGTVGYYEGAAPDLHSRDDGLVIPRDYGLQFFPGNGRFHIDFLNNTTALLYGSSLIQNQSNLIASSSTLTVTILSDRPMDLRYSFTENIRVVIDLPLDSYDGQRRKNILASIPFGTTNLIGDTLVYSPPWPHFAGIKYQEDSEVSQIQIRLVNDEGVEIESQQSVGLSLLFK